MVLGESTNLMLLVKPEYAEIQSLKGKRIGVIGTTSDSYYIMKWYLVGRGLDIDEDCEVVQISNAGNLVTAFQTGQLEAVVLFSGYAAEVMNSGGIKVVDCSEASKEVFGHASYSAVILINEGFVERGRAARSFLRALREAGREIRENPEEASRILAEFSGEPVEKVRTVLEMATLVADLDAGIEADLIAFAEAGAADGYFEEAFGEDFFFDGWR